MRRFTASLLAISALCLVAGVTNAAAAPPAILGVHFSHVTTSSALLQAEINPQGKETKYRFEYGTGNCASTPCTRIPVPEGKVPAAVKATGDLKEGSQTITNVSLKEGAFAVDDLITGAGILAATKVTAVDRAAKTLQISNAATANATGVALTATGPQPVPSVSIEGLTPHTAYHFRVVANNGEKAESPDTQFTTFALPQVFEACPNDALRANQPSGSLPDCRAYEQASPVDKNGVDARGRVSMTKAADNGEAISYGAAGGIPGAEGSQELPMYLASRGPNGWSTQGLLPPQEKGQAAYMLGWTPDLSETFSKANRVGPPEDVALLERSSADHSLKEVVPYGKGLFRPSLTGTSANANVVVLETTSKLTPAGVAGKSNVYAWDKATGKLRLASTLNDEAGEEGKSPPEGGIGGSYDWIAGTSPKTLHEGGAASAYYTQDNHAVSANGSVVFTSGGDGQLYMRRNPTAAQSKLNGEGKCTEAAAACTLHISASQKNNGKGPGGTDAAGSSPAPFLYASPDGSSVLFTSTEKLTNDATTGPEPPAPGLGKANLDGSNVDKEFCKTIAKGVAVDAGHIYWVSPEAGTISRDDLNCEGEPEVIVTGASNPQYVAVNAEHIYWTNAGDGKKETGTIGRAKLDGEEVDESFIKGATNPQGIALDGEHIYWSNAGEELPTRTIGRATLAGGSVDQVFVQVDSGLQRTTPQGLAVDASHIYVAVDSGVFQEFRELVRFDIDGNPASETFFFDGEEGGSGNIVPGLGGVVVEGGDLYWARQGGDAIGRIPTVDFTSGICETTIPTCKREFIKNAGHPQGLAADGSHLYWSVNGEVLPNRGNDLYRYETASGALKDLTVDGTDTNGAEVKGILGASEDTKTIYFAANGDLDGAGPAEKGDCEGFFEQLGPKFSGECNLYLEREGAPVTFVARLDANRVGVNSDASDWLPKGGIGDQGGKTARVSADGSTVIFVSDSKLTGYDNEGTPELYRYEVGDTAPSCISCNPTGEAPVEPGVTFANITLSTLVPSDFVATLTRNLSADGKRAFFQSTDPLVGTDTNGVGGCPEEGTQQKKTPSCQDVYEWEAQGSGSCKEDIQGGGCLYLISTGKSPQASFFADASTSGKDVFISTAVPGLVGQDQDGLFDIYDAREGGGLAAQNQVPPVPCESGEACHGPPGQSPAFQTPGSTSFKGPGNPKPKTCPKPKKGAKAKKGCAKKSNKKKHKGKKQKQTKKRGRAAR
jgi:WD40-like Beta Propeller Repeat